MVKSNSQFMLSWMTDGSALGKNYSEVTDRLTTGAFPSSLDSHWGALNRITESKSWDTSIMDFLVANLPKLLSISSHKLRTSPHFQQGSPI